MALKEIVANKSKRVVEVVANNKVAAVEVVMRVLSSLVKITLIP